MDARPTGESVTNIGKIITTMDSSVRGIVAIDTPRSQKLTIGAVMIDSRRGEVLWGQRNLSVPLKLIGGTRDTLVTRSPQF